MKIFLLLFASTIYRVQSVFKDITAAILADLVLQNNETAVIFGVPNQSCVRAAYTLPVVDLHR